MDLDSGLRAEYAKKELNLDGITDQKIAIDGVSARTGPGLNETFNWIE